MDKLCRRYNRINALMKRLQAAKDELKVQLMACDGEESERYTVSVSTVKQERIEGLKAIKDKSRSLFNALHEAGCIREVESTRLSVKEKK